MRVFRFGQQKRSVAAGAVDAHPSGCTKRYVTGERARAYVLIEKTSVDRIVYGVEATDAKPSFESALNQLETIVESMESGDVPLAELLAKFEEGNKLLKVCEARLKDAELKIELLKKQKDGVAFTKFETTSEA